MVQGPESRLLLKAWSQMCQAGPKPPTPQFKAVYPNLTTVQGNRFNFRGGDPTVMREALQHLFQDSLEGTAVRTHVEG